MPTEQYLRHFPREHLLVVTSENLRTNRRTTMRQIYEFLGVEVRFTAPTIGKEYYRTAGRRSYPPVVWAARRALKRHVPQAKRAKEMVDSLATRRRRARGPDQVVLPERLTQQVAACLADDVARLRPHVAGPFDGWGIG